MNNINQIFLLRNSCSETSWNKKHFNKSIPTKVSRAVWSGWINFLSRRLPKSHLAGDSLLLDKMKNSLIFVYILIFLIINECLCSDLYSDKVIKYDAESFKANVGSRIPHFISFFAPWYDNFLILFTVFAS